MKQTEQKKMVLLYPKEGKPYERINKFTKPTHEPTLMLERFIYLDDKGREHIRYKHKFYLVHYKEAVHEYYCYIPSKPKQKRKAFCYAWQY